MILTRPNNSLIKIIIADDHPIFREGLRQVLKKNNRFQVVDEAGDGNELLKKVREHRPHIVITDIKMPDVDGIAATRQIKSEFPEVEVIAISIYEDEDQILDMLQAGAKGYLIKNARKDEVFKAVEMVYSRQEYFCSVSSVRLLRHMMQSDYHPYRKSNKPSFSDREIEIIKLTCKEFCSKEIAEALHTNNRAIDSARERIREKVGTKSIIGVVMYAVKNGIYKFE